CAADRCDGGGRQIDADKSACCGPGLISAKRDIACSSLYSRSRKQRDVLAGVQGDVTSRYGSRAERGASANTYFGAGDSQAICRYRRRKCDVAGTIDLDFSEPG